MAWSWWVSVLALSFLFLLCLETFFPVLFLHFHEKRKTIGSLTGEGLTALRVGREGRVSWKG